MAVRRKWRDALFIGSMQVVVTGLRGVFRVWEWFAPPAKKQKLRTAREKMDAMERDRKSFFRKLETSNTEEVLALTDAFEDRWDSFTGPEWADIRARRDASRAKLRRMKEETEALQSLLRAHGNDTQDAIDGLRAYIEAHPKSEAAYSYLGVVFYKRKEWDESLAAYRQAEQLAMQTVAPKGDAAGDETHEVSVSLARLHIGDVLAEKGDGEAALAQYHFLIQNAPTDQSFPACYAYLKLGNVYQTMGQMNDARTAWKAAIKRDETGIVAKQARQKLKER